ncbi:MAG: alkaline phosphatase [Thermodesulfobacteriota bacterium]
MKKKFMQVAVVAVTGGIIVSGGPAGAGNKKEEHRHPERGQARNIIFMVPDGMGLSNVTAARIFVNGPDGDRLSFEKLPVIGYQSTHAANSTVTDSAAAASAWATGEKFNNNEVSCHSEGATCVDSPKTILELAREKNKATGLVATSTITHATPAAFAAHVNHRNCEAEIGRQLVQESSVDVLLGGNIGANSSNAAYNCAQYPGQDVAGIIAQAQDDGYVLVSTAQEMHATVASDDTVKILGLFNPAGLTPEYLRSPDSTEPRLPEMTRVALDILEEDKDGFFLMVEGSQIDWANHDNNAAYQLGEMIAFNEAVETVQAWINASPARRSSTLLIVAGDHETGGHAINGPYGTLSNPGDQVDPGWTSTNHTAVDTVVWSQGPGSANLGRAMDNTDLFTVMKNAMK